MTGASRRDLRWWREWFRVGAGTVLGCALLLGGCARSLTVIQATDHINTAMHRGRPPDSRTGQLLELNVVCVSPADLEKPQNAPLAPDAGITSDVWYKYRPEPGRGAGAGAFDLPASQVYLLTDDKEVYGVRSGPRVGRGKAGTKVKIPRIRFQERGWRSPAGGLLNRKAVIYVFPKFIGSDGEVLPVPPVKFHPPRSYRRELQVEVGVQDPGGAEIQYVKNVTRRRYGQEEEANP